MRKNITESVMSGAIQTDAAEKINIRRSDPGFADLRKRVSRPVRIQPGTICKKGFEASKKGTNRQVPGEEAQLGFHR